MIIYGTRHTNDPRVQRVIRDLNAYAAGWSTLNPSRHPFITICWNGKEYIGYLQYRSDQGTITVHVAYSGK